MDELYSYIEDLPGRADIPDQLYKDLIERFASAREEHLNKEKPKWVLSYLEISFTPDDEYSEGNSDGNINFETHKRTAYIPDDIAQKYEEFEDLRQFEPLTKNNNGHLIPTDEETYNQLGNITISGSCYRFMSLDHT